MKENKKENIFSRFLNVFGIIIIGISVFIIIYLTHDTLSRRDDENSFIRCSDGSEYNLLSLRTHFGITLIYNEKEFNIKEDKKVKTLCKLSESKDSQIRKILEDLNPTSIIQISEKVSVPEYNNYYLFLHNVKEDSSQWIIIYCVLGIVGVYLVVNLIREVILYIFFGKKLSKDILKPFN